MTPTVLESAPPTPNLLPADNPPPELSRWTTAEKKDIAPAQQRHIIHSYFNICPESPDGKYVLYYTSDAANGEKGDIRILERATGKETIIASDITTEDAHRAACQQWSNNGRTVIYHDCRDGRWFVMAYDLASASTTVLAGDRQLGFGSPTGQWAPVYGCHWNPGPHRNLELINVVTGETRTPVTAQQVAREYPDYIQEKFQSTDISIFFPVMSQDEKMVFFKIAKPGGGSDFHSWAASKRDGKVVFDLVNGQFVRLIRQWGHPSWIPGRHAIFEKGNFDFDVHSGISTRHCPSSPSNHPTVSPSDPVFVTDAEASKRPYGKPGDWTITVGSLQEDAFVIVDQFNNTHGAASWRRCHPHPTFSADGHRIYYNVASGPWTRLMVAEAK